MITRSSRLPIKPSAFGLVLYAPFPIVIGWGVLSLALAYWAVGAFPTEILTTFTFDAVIATLPIALNLLVVWAVYWVICTLATCSVYTFLISTEDTEWYIGFLVAESSPVLNRHSLIKLLSRLTSGLSIVSWRRGLPDHLASGWHASTDPQIE